MKQGMALRVVDEKQIDRVFSHIETERLFLLEDDEVDSSDSEQKKKSIENDDVIIMAPPPKLQDPGTGPLRVNDFLMRNLIETFGTKDLVKKAIGKDIEDEKS